MKKVTVIIPTYNSALTIQRVMQSVSKQNYNNIELIIADDCSGDNTLDIIQESWDEKAGRECKVVVNEFNSGGPNLGKNKALTMATGDYIAFCDHDDEWHPNKIKLQVELLERTGYLICSTGRKNINTVTGEEQNFVGYKEEYGLNEMFLGVLSPTYSKQIYYCIMGGIMIDKSLKNYQFENLYGVAEFSWMLAIYHNRYSCEVLQPLSIRYITGNNFSLSDRYRYQDFICKRQAFLMYKDLYPKEVKECLWKYEGSEGRYYYLHGNYHQARSHFLRSKPTLKNLAYYISSFICPDFVKTHFHIFG